MKTVKSRKCTGCGACENVCVEKAISMCTEREGFWYPAIDGDKCIQCGRCLEVCPISNVEEIDCEEKAAQKITVYAAWSLDQEIRYHSTSGGIFSELALSVLNNGGYVCGAVYDNEQMVKHFVTNQVKELERLRQSKYVQSYMGDIYIKVEKLLRENKIVLFCGTPCQCRGIFNYCRAKNTAMSNLYLIDFICRGANSPKIYRKFLNELKDKYNSDIDKVWFKNKTYGWNRFSTKIEFANGESYLKDRYHDSYIRGYIEENLFIRSSCTVCEFKGFHRTADLTLADFWGVQLDKKWMKNSDAGTSMVMVHTKRGRELWDAISSRIYKVSKKIEDVIPGNYCFEHSIQHGANRMQFMEDLDKMPVIDNIERFLKVN